jgi:hypothetical protein
VSVGLGGRGINARAERVVEGDVACFSAQWIRSSPLAQRGCYVDVQSTRTLERSVWPVALRHLSSDECIL